MFVLEVKVQYTITLYHDNMGSGISYCTVDHVTCINTMQHTNTYNANVCTVRLSSTRAIYVRINNTREGKEGESLVMNRALPVRGQQLTRSESLGTRLVYNGCS